jgi:hypothetical protein
MWWSILLSLVAGLALIYLVLLGLLWRTHRRQPGTVSMRDTLRLGPDLVRLLRRLAGDPNLPRGVRIRLILLLAYLLSPIDLIPISCPSSVMRTTPSSWPSRYGRSPERPDRTRSNDIGQAPLKAFTPYADSLASDSRDSSNGFIACTYRAVAKTHPCRWRALRSKVGDRLDCQSPCFGRTEHSDPPGRDL